MKYYILISLSFINKLWLRTFNHCNLKISGLFFKVKINSNKHNLIRINNSEVIHSEFTMEGDGNEIIGYNIFIKNSSLSIKGKNNQIIFGDGVKLREGNLIIRGNNCKILIGNRSTFGGVRMVNVGANNVISIGKDCLFSDNIEIWASDTHAIYDENQNWINHEQPIYIEDNVWVGSKVTVLKGVSIGSGSIIGMCSVVTKNISPNMVCAGMPIRILKENISWKLEYPTDKM